MGPECYAMMPPIPPRMIAESNERVHVTAFKVIMSRDDIKQELHIAEPNGNRYSLPSRMNS